MACYVMAVSEMTTCALSASMKNPNLFLVPYASGEQFCDAICKSLRAEFPTRILDSTLPTTDTNARRRTHICIAIDSSRPEKVKDVIREELWLSRKDGVASGSVHDIMAGTYEKTVREFRLEDYGIFVPFRTIKPSAIRTHSFHHRPIFYRYRLALDRVSNAPDPLRDYLEALFASCPNHVFNQSTFRASAVRAEQLSLDIPLDKVDAHDMLTLARASVGYEAVKSRHENLQKFLLQYDPKTIASEVPVWVESWELKEYHEIFQTRENLTGHIDMLRCEDRDTLGVWDYKPNAADERSAGVQVFLYALMLSFRTGLPMTRFVCGYFDECAAYVFRPSKVRLAHER